MSRMRPEWWLSLMVVVVGVGTAPGRGPNDVGLRELIDEGNKPAIKEVRSKLFRGELPANPAEKDHLAAIDYSARWYTYRFANRQFHTGSGANSIASLYLDFDKEVQNLVNGKEKTSECARLFAHDVIKYGKEVLDTNSPIAQVNVARVLARSAALGNPELADGVLDILKEARYNDAVKYWALHGLIDLLKMGAGNPKFLGTEREEKVAAGLIDFIGRKTEVVPGITPRDEIEGVRVLRREAIRALAQMRVPMCSKKVLPALALLRLVANEEHMPPLRADERIEAAIGLARMRPDKDKDYQPAYAAQQIALSLSDFAAFYTNNNEHKPCRVYAAKLGEALDGLKNDTKDPYVLALFDGGNPGQKLLEKIEKGMTGADPSDVEQAAKSNLPPVGQLFKSITDSKVQPANKEENPKSEEKK
jgi:hypothetical protein